MAMQETPRLDHHSRDPKPCSAMMMFVGVKCRVPSIAYTRRRPETRAATETGSQVVRLASTDTDFPSSKALGISLNMLAAP